MPVTKPYFLTSLTRNQQWAEIIVAAGGDINDRRHYASSFTPRQQLAKLYKVLGGVRNERTVASMSIPQILAEVYEELGGTASKRAFEHWSYDQQLFGIYDALGGTIGKLTFEQGFTRDQQLAEIWGKFGAAPPFDPNTISGLQFWINADNVLFSTQPDVIGFTDLSTFGRTVSLNELDMPILQEDALNGHPVVHFAGLSSFAVSPNIAADAMTAFIVINADSATLGDFSTIFITTNFRINARTTSDGWGTWLGGAPLTGDPLINGIYRVLEMFSAGGGGSGTELWGDGVQEAVSTFDSSGSGTSQIGNEGVMARYLVGDLAEFLVWDRVLNSTERNAVRSWLFGKYNLP